MLTVSVSPLAVASPAMLTVLPAVPALAMLTVDAPAPLPINTELVRWMSLELSCLSELYHQL